MTFTQSQVGFGHSVVSQAGIGASGAGAGMTDAMKVINDSIRTMAPVINSKFAVSDATGHGYVKFSTVGLRYCYPSDTGLKDSTSSQTYAYGTNYGIDCCVHYYQGASYLSLLGDTISPGFYIFATTSHKADALNTSVTFQIADTLATSVTRIGESRADIPVVSGGFTDVFEYAWTVRLYRVNH
jgi:hypothetical protein